MISGCAKTRSASERHYYVKVRIPEFPQRTPSLRPEVRPAIKTKGDKMRAHSISSVLTRVPLLAACACAPLSETTVDPTTGVNGSFETTKAGLPVNWIIYTPKTVPAGDFDVVVDTVQFKDGRQSLKFLVRKPSPNGGRLSPGLSQVFKGSPGQTFKVSFWAKNEGCEFLARVGGVAAKTGVYDTIVKSNETTADWRQFEHTYTIPPQMNALRLELNVLQPGTLWIDDIRIETVGAMHR